MATTPPADPAVTLTNAIQAVADAAAAYSASIKTRTTHTFKAGAFRAHLMGGQLQKLIRA